eukprot:500861-Hanusia_phi.AAC.1
MSSSVFRASSISAPACSSDLFLLSCRWSVREAGREGKMRGKRGGGGGEKQERRRKRGGREEEEERKGGLEEGRNGSGKEEAKGGKEVGTCRPAISRSSSLIDFSCSILFSSFLAFVCGGQQARATSELRRRKKQEGEARSGKEEKE